MLYRKINAYFCPIIYGSQSPRSTNPILGSDQIPCWIVSKLGDAAKFYRIPGDGVALDSIDVGSYRTQY
ncbi:unnamed protein product [Adineta ricciae]|uniref:Uncharacterized protein n=1 Tax=Adineta ricciae TaxID=249248 RepID=A0A815VNF9_ADIRI|nr:unnamed protein product [Adineta ricciae]CAF1532738.1 unnamed protein product [Adineta ricciae]